MLQKGKHYLTEKLFNSQTTTPETAYNLWAENYDYQPYNLMLSLDEEILTELMSYLDLKNKVIADVGCGTGRHWDNFLHHQPEKLLGFDVSKGMLDMLKKKFPKAQTHHLINDKLSELDNESCDIVFSTLTIAHIKNAADVLQEWKRVLKPGGQIIITDYHPIALAKGARRTFNYNKKTIAVRNYVHSTESIKKIAKQLHLKVLHFMEKSIDEKSRPFYENQNALDLYEAWKGTPIIYGIHLKK